MEAHPKKRPKATETTDHRLKPLFFKLINVGIDYSDRKLTPYGLASKLY